MYKHIKIHGTTDKWKIRQGFWPRKPILQVEEYCTQEYMYGSSPIFYRWRDASYSEVVELLYANTDRSRNESADVAKLRQRANTAVQQLLEDGYDGTTTIVLPLIQDLLRAVIAKNENKKEV